MSRASIPLNARVWVSGIYRPRTRIVRLQRELVGQEARGERTKATATRRRLAQLTTDQAFSELMFYPDLGTA